MFRIFFFPSGAMSQASPIWANESRGGADAGRDKSRGIRSGAGAYLIYDAS